MASHLPLRVLTARELQADDVRLPAFDLINESYKSDSGSDGYLHRYATPEEFLQDVGTDGLCAIVQDSQNNNFPVAVAVAKRWQGRRDLNRETSRGDGRDWEIGPAASRNLPQYRSQGLIERCLQGLSARLLDQVDEGTVCLWIKTVEDSYATYWARRGFEQCGASYVIPVGQWHRDQSYILVDMKKEISRGKDGGREGLLSRS